MILILTLYLSFNFNASASNVDNQVFMQRAQQTPVHIIQYRKVRIFNLSSTEKKNCKACQAIDRALLEDISELERPVRPGMFNPALILCEKLKGNLKTIYDLKENEISVCSFDDQSFYFSWDLFKLLPTK